MATPKLSRKAMGRPKADDPEAILGVVEGRRKVFDLA